MFSHSLISYVFSNDSSGRDYCNNMPGYSLNTSEGWQSWIYCSQNNSDLQETSLSSHFKRGHSHSVSVIIQTTTAFPPGLALTGATEFKNSNIKLGFIKERERSNIKYECFYVTAAASDQKFKVPPPSLLPPQLGCEACFYIQYTITVRRMIS